MDAPDWDARVATLAAHQPCYRRSLATYAAELAPGCDRHAIE